MKLVDPVKIRLRCIGEIAAITAVTPFAMALLSSTVAKFSELVGLWGNAPIALGALASFALFCAAVACVCAVINLRERQAKMYEEACKPRRPIF